MFWYATIKMWDKKTTTNSKAVITTITLNRLIAFKWGKIANLDKRKADNSLKQCVIANRRIHNKAKTNVSNNYRT